MLVVGREAVVFVVVVGLRVADVVVVVVVVVVDGRVVVDGLSLNVVEVVDRLDVDPLSGWLFECSEQPVAKPNNMHEHTIIIHRRINI